MKKQRKQKRMWMQKCGREQMTTVLQFGCDQGCEGCETWQNQDKAGSGSMQTSGVAGNLMRSTSWGLCSSFQGES
jgi:hypothetical protein